MARIKPKNEIMTRDQAEEAMKRLDEIERRFAEWDLEEAAAVAEVRERFIEKRKAANYAGLEAQRSLLVKELQAWAETDSANWKGKTLPMQCGSVGYRVTQPTVKLIKRVCKSFADLLTGLKLLKPEFIRTKEEVDKEAILAAYREGTVDDAILATLGIKVEQADEFWIETSASKDLEEAVKKLRAA